VTWADRRLHDRSVAAIGLRKRNRAVGTTLLSRDNLVKRTGSGAPVDFRLLGPFEVVDGGSPISLGGRRQRAVLALLTIHAGEVLSADRIADDIWSGAPPSSAVGTLQSYVSRLRGSLRSSVARRDVLVSRSPGYLLAVESSEIDSARFELHLAEAERLIEAERAEEARPLLTNALGSWRGLALADFAYEPFAAHESQRLMARRLDALELLIEADLVLGRHVQVVAEVERLVAEHSLRERFSAQLMLALYRCGRQADALSVYRRLRHNLVEELGIEPGPELRRLEQLVLEQSPVLERGRTGSILSERADRAKTAVASTELRRDGSGTDHGRTHSAETARRHELPLVGRSAHLKDLTELLETAQPNERPRLKIVLGESGCGKTRLLAEFGRLASLRGALVASGSAERDSSLPYGPIVEIVRGVLNQTGLESLDKLGPLRADLARLLPELEEQSSPPPSDLGVARSRLFESIIKLLFSVGKGEPIVILIDDAQWFESTSLLHAMLNRTWPRAVLLVFSYRTDPAAFSGRTVDSPLVDMLRREDVSSLEVGRLTDSDLTDLLVRQHKSQGGPSPTAELVRFYSEQTAGIPLLLRELITSGRSSEQDVSPSAGRTQRLSPLVQRVLEGRLEELPRSTRALLEIACVIGLRFDTWVLAETLRNSGNDEHGIDDQLEIALRSGVLVETDELDHYAFDHALYREVLMDSLSTRRRFRLHSLIAEALEDRGSPVEAARHALSGYVTGMSPEAAVAMVIQAADFAVETLDFEISKSLCEKALSGPAHDLGPEAKANLFMRLGRAESLTGNFEAAEIAWGEAARLVRTTGDVELFSEIALATELHARMHSASSDLRWSLLTEALEKLGPGWTSSRLVVATQWLQEAAMPSRRSVSLELADEVVAAAMGLGDNDALAAALNARYSLARLYELPERRSWCAELHRVAVASGSDQWRFHACLAELIDCVAFAEASALDDALDRLRESTSRYRLPRALWVEALSEATCARMRGKFVKADEHLHEASRLGTDFRIIDSPVAIGAAGFTNAFHLGGLEPLRRALEDFSATMPLIPAWKFGAGISAAVSGDYAAARSFLQAGEDVLTDTPDEFWLPSLCLAAEIVGFTGADPPLVTRITQLLKPFAGRIAVAGTLAGEFGPVDRCLGLLAAASGDFNAAAEYFDSALSICFDMNAPPWELRTRTDWFCTERSAGLPSRPWWTSLESDLRSAGLRGALLKLARQNLLRDDSC
jgi:DNA-binding SARP family transcriptional activator/tetratricopeptide (TPR) repeat protein